MWESQERAMRSAPYARTVEWDLNTSPPMQWHFGPPPEGWGSYLQGVNIPTARGQVVDAQKFYTQPTVRFGRGFAGLGAIFALSGSTPGMREVQTQLARLGFLFNEESPQGIDGRWGSRTEMALRHAANYVGFTGTPSTVTRTGLVPTVEIPDELLTAIRNAPAAPPGTTGLVSAETDTGTQPGSSSESSSGLGMGLLFLAAVAAAGYYYGRR
jgi:peptidoglycan hydrolase-like protein with peptidoglycan-binding domain